MKSQKRAVAIIGENLCDIFEGHLMDETIYMLIVREIEKLIRKGYTQFVINPRTDFELFALTILRNAKQDNENIEIILVDGDAYDEVLDMSGHILTLYTGRSELLHMSQYSITADIPMTNIAAKWLDD